MYIIANPRAGTKAGVVVNRAGLQAVRDIAVRQGLAYTLVPTRHRGDATELARRAVANGERLIVAAGGDGTIREVATALLDSPATLGILPLGSAMNVARGLGIPRNLAAAFELLRRAEQVERIDLGRVHDHVFLEAGGVGIIAGVLHLLDLLDRGRWRHLRTLMRYLRSASPATLTVEADGQQVWHGPTLSLLIANAPFTGASLAISPQATLNDGLLNGKVFLSKSQRGLALAWLRLALGQSWGREDVIEFRAARIDVQARRQVLVHADHQLVEDTPASFCVVPAALPVIVGRQAPGLVAVGAASARRSSGAGGRNLSTSDGKDLSDGATVLGLH